MTDYKQLCADLVAAWDDLPWHYDWKGNLIGLADGCQLDDSAVERARAALAEPEPEPVAWMYQGEPSFDGTDWQETWEVTTDKRLAEFKATPDQPIPLFSIPPQHQ